MILKDKAAIITGGSRGIGAAVAKVFVREGARLMIAARSREELDSIKKELEKDGANVEVCVADIANRDDVRNLVAQAKSKFGTIDILVNAAGIYGPIGPSEKVNFDAWKNTFAVNVFGTFSVLQEVLPGMRAQKHGKIINFGGGGDGPFPRFTAYSASKISIVRLTEGIAEEVKEDGIDINAVAPGGVNTFLLDQALAAGEEMVGKERYAAFLKQRDAGGIPPEKAGELCAFLASERSNGLTGKLVSAVWDDWKNWGPDEIAEIMKSDRLTMRRVNK
jgi:3-oxoacyl-[acyl-carrier protein] reductase